jgi:RNA polymerase sigma factor (TIGR02999 family)
MGYGCELFLDVNAQAAGKSRQIFCSFFSNRCVKIESNQEGVSKREVVPMNSSAQSHRISEPDTAREPAAPDRNEMTRWLLAGSGGDVRALEALLPLVYDELHRQAVCFFHRERAGHTLQPTALVNEVYLRLINQHEVNWQNRAQFFAIAAEMMRRILVSHARARQAQKRGGAVQQITLDEGLAAEPQRDLNLLALDDALTRLEQLDPEKSRMVELRFFSGLSVEETAEVMGVSPRTIDRKWQMAKAWLHREIGKAA